MLPPQQSRQFYLYLHLIYANHKHITHKMWRRVTTSYGVPLMILIHSAQTKKEPSTSQYRLHMSLHVNPKITEKTSELNLVRKMILIICFLKDNDSHTFQSNRTKYH